MLCPHTLNSLYIDNDGYVYPCFYTANKFTNAIVKHQGTLVHASTLDPTNILEWDSIKELRNNLKDNKWPTCCSKCRLLEDRNFPSPRTKKPITTTIPRLEIIHLRLGNKCNLRCVMCGPHASNQWYDDYVNISQTTKFKVANNTYILEKNNNSYALTSTNFNFSENEKLAEIIAAKSDDVREIHFHGGEPLLSKSHNKLIELLISKNLASNISLFYHTNATIYNKAIFDKLLDFKQVTFILSLDGIGLINDAIRWPSKWETILATIEKMQIFNLQVNHTVHMLNAEHLSNFLIEMERLNLPTTINLVTEPGYISLSGLCDQPQLQKLIEHNGKFGEHLNKAAIIKSNDFQVAANRQTFKRLWTNFTATQNQSWNELFPLALKSMNEWKNC